MVSSGSPTTRTSRDRTGTEMLASSFSWPPNIEFPCRKRLAITPDAEQHGSDLSRECDARHRWPLPSRYVVVVQLTQWACTDRGVHRYLSQETSQVRLTSSI